LSSKISGIFIFLRRTTDLQLFLIISILTGRLNKLVDIKFLPELLSNDFFELCNVN